MRPMQPERPRLRKREIVFAVAAGIVAAGGAALILGDSGDDHEMPAIAAPTEMTYQVTDFDEISTVGPQDVVVTLGDTFSVRSEGSPAAHALLDATVVNGRLTIRPKDADFNFFRWPGNASATYYVTLPRLDGIAVAGSGDVSVDRIEGQSFEAAIAGPGSLAIAAMAVQNANFTIGGQGDITVAGTARETHVSIAGTGEVQGGGLRSETASVSIGGTGDVALTVENEAKVSIMGTGDVDISGPARCSVTQMGTGNVRCSGGGGTEDGRDNEANDDT